ncbi:hypothetical protein Malapachy_3052 [Malassezia pachydermatis]|uniref:Uncharacterized protein n=1 Tax=Malassezia pachydermatis TaxID=77020 RepID=A0A0M8MST1_9BASI|nr:hypothetical protein Malapachy_3052 [Malassezia pachydermatis]KOS16037.1 hypothetical protein Malapachy_3052 [Malassezia pachydermatis]
MSSSVAANGTASSTDVQKMIQAIDALQQVHLPAVRRAMDALFERITIGLAGEADGQAVEDALDVAQTQIQALSEHLQAHGLAGLTTNEPGSDTQRDLRATTRALFDQRTRLSDATALVASILSKT